MPNVARRRAAARKLKKELKQQMKGGLNVANRMTLANSQFSHLEELQSLSLSSRHSRNRMTIKQQSEGDQEEEDEVDDDDDDVAFPAKSMHVHRGDFAFHWRVSVRAFYLQCIRTCIATVLGMEENGRTRKKTLIVRNLI